MIEVNNNIISFKKYGKLYEQNIPSLNLKYARLDTRNNYKIVSGIKITLTPDEELTLRNIVANSFTKEEILNKAKENARDTAKLHRENKIAKPINNVQVAKPVDRENIQGSITYFETLAQGADTINWTMADNSIVALTKTDLQDIIDTYVLRKAQAFAEYQADVATIEKCNSIQELNTAMAKSEV